MIDYESERAEVLVGVRKVLASLAEDAEMLEAQAADGPTPEARHELETIGHEIEANERGLAGIVKRLGEYGAPDTIATDTPSCVARGYSERGSMARKALSSI